jgi:uncharacterized protein YggE
VSNEKPSVSFSEAREKVLSATAFLGSFHELEFGTSRVRLVRERRFIGGESRFTGYRARVEISVQLKQLDDLEKVASGLVEAGANEIEAIDFQTSRLKELRAEARTLAMAAAREKAALYARAAEVRLGRVIHIQDVNPQVMNALHRQAGGHESGPSSPEGESDDAQFLDPAAIEVQAAVLVAYEID